MATTKITSPDLFDLGSLNTALKLPSGTTAERPTSPSTGEWRYNTTTNLVEFWDGGEWRDLQSENIPPINSEHFNTVLYDGNSGTQAITGVGFQPDWVWIKQRDTAAENHNLTDSTRGTNKILNSNNTNAEVTSTSRITSFDSDGFTLGNNNETNDSGSKYVAWCWKANGGTTSSNTDGAITSTIQVNSPDTYFSIIRYNGNYTQGTTLGHGLGTAPGVGWIGRTSNSENRRSFWQISGTAGTPYQVTSDAPSGATPTQPNSFFPSNATSSVVNYGNDPSINFTSSYQYIFYLFASVTNFTNFGTYSGNGGTQAITTGFAPKLIWIQRQDAAGNWQIYDSVRGNTKILMMNNSQAEITDTRLTFDSNGFTLNATAVSNGSGSTFWYCAWA